MSNELNGWNTELLKDAVESVKQKPESGKLTWRSKVSWDGGFGLDVRTNEIEQLGDVIERRFTMRGDHPSELLGNNTGPTAIETIMAALGSCMAGNFAVQATTRGVTIEALEVDLECAIDLNGMFGMKQIRPGLSDVKLSFRVKSDAAPAMLQEILDAAQSLSPVFDSVTKPVGVKTSLVKA
jgi:uncharacterized OsmC-like protein